MDLPLKVFLRKTLWLRLPFCVRRVLTLLLAHRGRNCLSTFAVFLCVAAAFSLLLEVRAVSAVEQQGIAVASNSNDASVPDGVDAAAAYANPTPLPLPLNNSVPYMQQVQRRAAELNKNELGVPFSSTTAQPSNQQKLRKTADQLLHELQQLKEARKSSFSVVRSGGGGGGAGGGGGGGGGGGIDIEPCERHAEFRIAMLMPWVADESGSHAIPEWLPFFVATAARSDMLVDWLVLHEGPLGVEAEERLPRNRPSNVKLIDLGVGGIATLVGSRMSTQLGLEEANATALTQAMRFMLKKWPRLIAEYKPAFGAIFAGYLSNYSHWGYSDLDVVLGDVPRLVARSELEENDIVSYSFGDHEALYLRGQWTLHRNAPHVNKLWMRCNHLGAGLYAEIAQKVAWVRRNEAAGRGRAYPKRFLTAEGCYSQRAMQAGEGGGSSDGDDDKVDIKVKIAQKQFVGLERTGHASAEVYVVNGALWLCSQSGSGEGGFGSVGGGGGSGTPDLRELVRKSARVCDQALPETNIALGKAEPLEITAEGCGSWIPPEHRLCASSLKGRNKLTIFRRDGQFFAQPFEYAPEIVADNGRCVQGAFFHMQEWKKRWDDGKAHFDPAASYGTFKLTQDGFHRLDLPAAASD